MKKHRGKKMKSGVARSLSVALAMAAVLWCGGGAARAQTAFGLSSCFIDSGSATLSSVTSQANTQALNGPKFPSASVNDHWILEGNFRPRSSQTRLAIFSDDGANVSRAELDANGNPMGWAPINATLGVGQALPNLGQSFHVMNETWNTDKNYSIKIEYKNLSYSPTTTVPDVDGLTLFAFNGGGTISDSGNPPAPEYAYISHLSYSTNGINWYEVSGGVIDVIVGQELSLSITKAGGDIWPDGKPSWSGTAGFGGTGTSQSKTFSQLGTYSVLVSGGTGNEVQVGIDVLNVNFCELAN